jgi:copper chaperone
VSESPFFGAKVRLDNPLLAGLFMQVYGGMTMKNIKIKGMSCQHCVMAVTRALNAVDGIKEVKVDLASGVATYREDKPVSSEMVAAAIKKAGYEVVE